MFKLRGKRPAHLGVHDGRLAPPPRKPNCVSSQAAGGPAAIEPLRFSGDPAAAMQRLQTLVAAEAEIIEATQDYLYAEYSTPLMGFVDDVEFLLGDGVIHLRSASRLGYSDLGANRKRIERLRARFG